MASDSSANPYATPNNEIVSPMPWADSPEMDYTESVKFVFANPNWLLNIALLAICLIISNFIPVLPLLVIMGYQCEILEALFRRPREIYPDFKIEKIMDYLVRGLWPFVIALIGTLIMIPLILLVIAVPTIAMVLLGRATGEDGMPIVMAVMVPIIVLVGIAAAIAFQVALVPFLLRSVLTQDIGASFDFQFAKDFVRRMWKETIIAGLFLIAVALAAQIIGLLMLCIGVLFTMPLMYFTQAHLGMQLYRLYLARGGQKIPFKAA